MQFVFQIKIISQSKILESQHGEVVIEMGRFGFKSLLSPEGYWPTPELLGG